jgi:hypothetical protein
LSSRAAILAARAPACPAFQGGEKTMKTQILGAALVLSLVLAGSASAQMASDKPMAAGAMSSEHMKSDKMAKPMAKTPMKKAMKKPMAKTDAMAKPATAGAMSSSMTSDAMAKH